MARHCKRGLAKPTVVFQRVPEDLQHVAFGVFDAAVDFVAPETPSLVNDRGQPTLDGLFEGSVLAGWMRMSASSRIMGKRLQASGTNG